MRHKVRQNLEEEGKFFSLKKKKKHKHKKSSKALLSTHENVK